MLLTIAKNVLEFLGSELVHYEPPVQEFITSELVQVSSLLTNYLNEKIEKKLEHHE